MPKLRKETLKDVPLDRVASIVDGFARDGALAIRVVRNLGGTWNITGSFPV